MAGYTAPVLTFNRVSRFSWEVEFLFYTQHLTFQSKLFDGAGYIWVFTQVWTKVRHDFKVQGFLLGPLHIDVNKF